MYEDKRWLLPVGFEEDLPPVAWRIERLRRRILDLFASWGYDLVIPPLIEYVESLLITGDKSLELQTLKFADQLDGRMIGVRADMTPQVARIDARMLNNHLINRLCYIGTTLKARPDNIHGTRSPLQFGAEIYGDAGCEGDAEIIHLMVEILKAIGVCDVYIDLGHVGVCSALSAVAGFDKRQENNFSTLLNRKAAHEINEYLDAQKISGKIREQLTALLRLNGNSEVLDSARTLLGDVSGVGKALDELSKISARLSKLGINPHYDLAEIRGYHYKTGVVFAAFTPGTGQEIARGGRYDDIGKVFGRARPAVGFSGDLHMLVDIIANGEQDNDDDMHNKHAVFVPKLQIGENENLLDKEMARLRMQGMRVVQQLHEDDTPASLNCSRELVLENDQWIVKEL